MFTNVTETLPLRDRQNGIIRIEHNDSDLYLTYSPLTGWNLNRRTEKDGKTFRDYIAYIGYRTQEKAQQYLLAYQVANA